MDLSGDPTNLTPGKFAYKLNRQIETNERCIIQLRCFSFIIVGCLFD